MRFSKQIFAISVVLPLIAGLGGCATSMIGVHPGTDRVSLADANQVGACKSMGKVIVSVMAKVGFIDRSELARQRHRVFAWSRVLRTANHKN